MDRELEELKEEIFYLKKRISLLEKAEKSRKITKYTKIIIKIIMICFFAFMLWRGYDYIVNSIPKIIEEKVQSIIPFKKG